MSSRAVPILAYVLALSVSGSLWAQSTPQKNTSSGWEADLKNTPANKTNTSATNPSWNEADFIKKANEGMRAEMEYGELALQKATTEATRNYARRLIADYAQAQQAFSAITSSNNGGTFYSPNAKGSYGSESQSEANVTCDDFGVHGSGLGTGGGTTGTVVSRPNKGKKYKPDRLKVSNSKADSRSVGSGTAEVTGGGFGSLVDTVAVNKENPVNTSTAYSTEANPGLSAEQQLTRERLINLSGVAFDRQYTQTANQEQDALATLLDSIPPGSNASLQQWAVQYLPMVRRNRDLAAELKIY